MMKYIIVLNVVMRHVSVSVFLVIGLVAALSATEPLPGQRPNILMIPVDDMNDWIGPLGGLDIAITPNLDRLAAMGMTFTNAHCASPACAPSRLAVMSGVRPSRSGVMQNIWEDGPFWRDLPALDGVQVLEEFFQNNGYRTMGGGKIYHSLQWTDISQVDATVWDEYYPSAEQNIPHQIRAPEWITNPSHFWGKRHKYFLWGPIAAADEVMADYQVVDWALSKLKEEQDKPFYLVSGIFRPHMPWEVPQKYFDMYPLDQIPDLKIQENDLEDAWDHRRRPWHQFVLQNKEWKHVIQAYLASITFADAQIGRLLDGLEQSEYRDNTIIVLWADHGMHIGEKENWEKFTLWEESTRVPLFVVASGVTQPGSRCEKPACLLDVYPTLVELTGLPLPEHLDGVSLVPQLRDPSAPRIQPAITNFTWGTAGGRGDAVRTERWRYITYAGTTLEELYDHQTDPDEFVNLAYDPQYASIVKEHRAYLTEYINKDFPTDIIVPDGYTLDQKHRLHKTGFVPMETMVGQAIREHQLEEQE